MHTSRYFIQQLEKTVRQNRREIASEAAKKAGHKETPKTPAVKLAFDRNAKSYQMGRGS